MLVKKINIWPLWCWNYTEIDDGVLFFAMND